MPQLFISATHKSSGKTSVTVGLAAALSQRGLAVQTFKKGPDYIDPMWLAAASGRPCLNLDFYTMREAEIRAAFGDRAAAADIVLTEGNKGLYDGLDPKGADSNAALARLLGAPVLLIVDTLGMTRGIAPLVLGYQAFDPEVRIAGLILNKVGGPRHEAKLRAALEHYTDVPVLGAVARDSDLEIPERHLGLIPANEIEAARERVEKLATAVSGQVDLDGVLRLAGPLPDLPETFGISRPATRPCDVRIGVARDAAFGFYYPDDLEALAAAGAEVVPFDTLHDAHLPQVDGLFIGGGFPETQMGGLEANASLRHEIGAAIGAGMPAYAECGGLLYLTRSLTWGGERREMVGVIPADAVMHRRPQGRGYVQLEETADAPWPAAPASVQPRQPTLVAAHEFHYSSLENLPDGLACAYRVKRGFGIDGSHDGIVLGNLLANFCHLRDVAGSRWAGRFVAFVRARSGRR